jgi:hypothetical protein
MYSLVIFPLLPNTPCIRIRRCGRKLGVACVGSAYWVGLRHNQDVVDQRRTAATAPCKKIDRNLNVGWGTVATDCDEYPYATTREGGAGASVMLVPRGENRSHGARIGQFYEGNWSNRWRVRLQDGEHFATVITHWPVPNDPSLIRP